MVVYWQASDGYSPAIMPIEVDGVTEQFVTINGRRRAKISDYDSYHETWETAHAHLMARQQARVDTARRALKLANSKLGNIKGLKRPTPPVAGSGAEG